MNCYLDTPPGRDNTLEQAIERHKAMASAGRKLRIDENVVCDGTKCTGKSGSEECQKPIWLNIAIQYLGLNEGGNGTSGVDNVRKSGEKNDDDGDGTRHDYSDRTVKVNEGTPDEKKIEYNSEGESKDVKEFFKESDNYNAGSGVRTYDSPHAWCAAFVHYYFKKSKVKGYSPPKTGKDEYIVSSPRWQRDWGDVANPPCLGAVAYRIENHMGFIVGKGMAITNTRDEIRKYNKEIKAYLAINKKLRTNKDCPKPLVPKEQMCYFLLGGNQSQEVNITPFPIGDINIKKIQVPKGYKWCKKDEQLEDTKWVKYWYSQNPDRTVKGFTTR